MVCHPAASTHSYCSFLIWAVLRAEEPAFLSSGLSVNLAVVGRGGERETLRRWVSLSSCFRATTSSQRGAGKPLASPG